MINVGIGQGDQVALPEHKPPPLNQMGLIHGELPAPHEVWVLLRQEALQAIDDHGLSDVRTELGGVLLGRAFQYRGQTYVQVDAAVSAKSTEHGPVHFTFTADAWAQIHREREEYYPGMQIVGWFHTHPNLGVFYSSDDVVVHSVAFDMPWHVGLVVDPVRRQCCFFGWVPSERETNGRELKPIHGFYELTNQQPHSVIDWRVTHRSALSEMIEAAYNNYAGGEVYDDHVYRVVREATLFPPRINFAIATSAVVLALLLGVLMGWPLRSRANGLEQVALLLASERMQEQNAAGLTTCPNPTMQILLPKSQASYPVGTIVSFFGVADYPDVRGYQLDYRQVGPLNYRRQEMAQIPWQTADSFWFSQTFDNVGTWNTAALQPGTYQVRLVGYNSNKIPLSNSACVINITLLPPLVSPTVTIAPTAIPADYTPEPNVAPAPTPQDNSTTGGTTGIDN